MKKFFFIFPCILLVAFVCNKKTHPYINCGKVIAKTLFFNPSKGKYESFPLDWPDLEMWFKDSLVIVKAMGINITVDPNGHRTTEVKLAHYTFIDLPKRHFYKYLSFTDTSTIASKYTQPDSVSGDVLWDFFIIPKVPATEPAQSMTDTIIDGISFKRNRLINTIQTKNGKEKRVAIAYYRCDKNGSLFKIEQFFSEKMGCPMVKLQHLPSVTNSHPYISEIEFTANKLSIEELKIFDAWEKNARRYPVEK